MYSNECSSMGALPSVLTLEKSAIMIVFCLCTLNRSHLPLFMEDSSIMEIILLLQILHLIMPRQSLDIKLPT